MSDECIFCNIANNREPASIVYRDDLTMAFIDLRQFHAGHTLVIPRQHFHDVCELDTTTGAAIMATISKVTHAVGLAFPNHGISLWSSIGVAAFQEVPHVHIHVHPRMLNDEFLRIYPHTPPLPGSLIRDEYAALIRLHLD